MYNYYTRFVFAKDHRPPPPPGVFGHLSRFGESRVETTTRTNRNETIYSARIFRTRFVTPTTLGASVASPEYPKTVDKNRIFVTNNDFGFGRVQ